MSLTRAPDWIRRWHLVLPAVLTLALSFRAGGFFAGETALAAVVLTALLVLHVTLAHRPFAGWSPAIAVSAAGLAGLAAWTLLSALWSGAPGRALLEFDRVLLYGLVLAVMGAAPAGRRDLQWVLRWLLVAALAVAVAGLLSRVLPGVFPVSENIVDERLSFPVSYWNAMGMLTGVGLVLALHACSAPGEPLAVRLLAAAALPLLAVTLLFTFARGPLALTIVGLLLYAALSRARGLVSAVLAVGPPTAVALHRAFDADLLSRPEYADAAGIAQGRTMALVVGLCAVAAVVLRAAFLPLDARLERVRLSDRARRPVLAGAAIAALVAVSVAAVAADVPSRLQDARAEFSRGTILAPTGDLRERLAQLGNNGRLASWRVARDGFEAEPLLGSGAGTYRLTWEREREAEFQVVDAHSLYLEVLAELGAPGLALLVLAVVPLLAAAGRRIRGPARHAHAAFVAASAALLLHAGMDWDWEMPVLFAWFFGAGAVAVAAHGGSPARGGPGRVPRLVAGLAALLVAVTPALVLASQGPLDRGYRAFLDGDCRTTVDAALASLDALRVRAEPYELLGYCDARAGAGELAVRAMSAARARDPDNWQYAYGLAIARAVAGQDPRPAAQEARRLNPLEPLAIELERRMAATRSPARWRRIAGRARIPIG